jgi:glucan phosphoethanolaminetransferase (alkaline phosphatase superfamily)
MNNKIVISNRNNLIKKHNKLKEESSDLLLIVGLLTISFFILFFFIMLSADTKFEFERDREEIGFMENIYRSINNFLGIGQTKQQKCVRYIANNKPQTKSCKVINQEYSQQTNIDDLD